MEQKFAVGNLIFENLGIACNCLSFPIQWMLIMISLPLEIFEEKTRSFD